VLNNILQKKKTDIARAATRAEKAMFQNSGNPW
jgi:hypothetical protein